MRLDPSRDGLKVWCGWCKAYVHRATFEVHLTRHAERFGRSSGPDLMELLEGVPS
jgi:hypothetical protein